jgi:DNA polymerase-1
VILGWDLETNQLSPYTDTASILTVALADDKRAWGHVLDHPLAKSTKATKRKAVESVNKYLTDPLNWIVGHNIVAFDIPWWERLTGTRVAAQWFDTRVAYSLIDETADENTLDFLARKLTGLEKNPDGLNRKRLAEYDPAQVLKYNQLDAQISDALFKPLREQLIEANLWDLFLWRMEVGRVLVDMTLTGMHLDLDWIAVQSKALTKEKAEHEAWLLDVIGREIKLTSTKQLGALLYSPVASGGLGAPIVERSKKTGAPSTSETALKIIRSKTTSAAGQEFIDRLLKFRKASKYLGTYLKPLATKHLGSDGRIHATFNLAGTVTGRLSSSSPNLQNQPRDKRIKGSLATSPELRLFNADYSALEVRVAAWYSGEPAWLKAFAEGTDVHTVTLADMEGKPYAWVREQLAREEEAEGKLGFTWTEKRALIKRVNFGILYGVGAGRLVKLMRDMEIYISYTAAESIIARWSAKHQHVIAWVRKTENEIVKRGQVVTPTGRVRRLPDVDPDTGEGKRALRQGVNFMVQSLAGEIALQALLEVNRTVQHAGGAQLLGTVHDSLVGEYHPDDWSDEEMKETLQRCMVADTLAAVESRFGIPPTIPLAVDVKVGMERWA